MRHPNLDEIETPTDARDIEGDHPDGDNRTSNEILTRGAELAVRDGTAVPD